MKGNEKVFWANLISLMKFSKSDGLDTAKSRNYLANS
jgi:hypothetical protein